MKVNFNLPNTKLCIVVWYRNGVKSEILIDTPANTDRLQQVMLGHRVGLSEIRAIKSVSPLNLIGDAFSRALVNS